MKTITEKSVSDMRKLNPKRCCFEEDKSKTHNHGITDDSKSFIVPFSETIKKIFEKDTNLELSQKSGTDEFYRVIKPGTELGEIKDWEKRQGSRIYLRDCLSLSIAMSINISNDPEKRVNDTGHTLMGKFVNDGKWSKSQSAINEIVKEATKAIQDLPYYKDTKLICSVPNSGDNFNLPCSVTSLLSDDIEIQDITDGFVFGSPKANLKNSLRDEKWNELEKAQISFDVKKFNVEGKNIILIDDLYQSGTTIQYIAMKLQLAGACEVYGLCFLKTRGDKDNKGAL